MLKQTLLFLSERNDLKKVLFKLLKGKELANTRGSGLGDKLLQYTDLIANDGAFTPAEIDPDTDIALFQYTGGTTGVPKGAMLTHANISINCEQIKLWNTGAEIGKERVLAILPFFHVFAMTCIMNTAVKCGWQIILMPRFDLEMAVKIIKKERPTLLPGVPTLYTALMNHPGLSGDGLSSLKLCMSGGAPLPLEVRKEFEALSGCRLIEGYGLSETSPVATANPFNFEQSAGSTFKILDTNGTTLPQTMANNTAIANGGATQFQLTGTPFTTGTSCP